MKTFTWQKESLSTFRATFVAVQKSLSAVEKSLQATLFSTTFLQGGGFVCCHDRGCGHAVNTLGEKDLRAMRFLIANLLWMGQGMFVVLIVGEVIQSALQAVEACEQRNSRLRTRLDWGRAYL